MNRAEPPLRACVSSTQAVPHGAREGATRCPRRVDGARHGHDEVAVERAVPSTVHDGGWRSVAVVARPRAEVGHRNHEDAVPELLDDAASSLDPSWCPARIGGCEEIVVGADQPDRLSTTSTART